MSFVLSMHQWSQLKSALLDWFTDPEQVLLPLCGIALVTFALRRLPYRNVILRSLGILGVAYGVLISPVGAVITTEGLGLFLEADVGQPADAIVVLGRGPLAEQERALAAVELWQGKRAPIILMTGRGEAPRLSEQITFSGVPTAVQLIENQARTTEENAQFSYPLLQAAGVRRLILITDQPHMLRSVLTFQSFGFQVTPFPVNVPPSLPAIERTALALREYLGIASYAIVGRFQSRSAAVAALPDR